MNAHDSRYDIVIIGAGLAGCATAQALALADPNRQRRILLVDRHRDFHPRFSGELIHPRGAQVLDDLGFYGPLLHAGAIDVDGFAVYENADGRSVNLRYASVEGQRPRGLSVHHKALVKVMRRRLRNTGHVELIEGCSISEIVRGADDRIAGAVLDGPDRIRRTVHCDLLVGADGNGSAVRKLARMPDRRRTIGFTAGIEVRGASLPHPRHAHVILGASGPILAYPILRDEDGTISARVTFDLPRELPAKGPELKAWLLRAYVPFIPAPLSAEVAAAIEAHHGALKMAPTADLAAPPVVMPGLVLVGDAAGCSHPITASGMTMGLRDAETLGREAARQAHVPAEQPWLDFRSLRRYRSEHGRYAPTRQALADAIYEAFCGQGEGARAIRRALFDYWHSSDEARTRSMALLSCSEGRPSVFLREYLRTARCAIEASLVPRSTHYNPMSNRVRRARGAARLACDKLGLVMQMIWAQARANWLSRSGLIL